jgi:CRISPR-associated protein Cas5
MKMVNLNFLLEKPDFSARGKLAIESLAPLSMVASLPGKYYRSQLEPTDAMLYGMLENALGWHVSTKERNELGKKLKQKFGEPEKTGVGFVSLLQFHLRFTTRVLPPLLHYDDYWSQHQKGSRFTTGSRNHDSRLIALLNATKDETKDIRIEERAGFRRDAEVIANFQNGERIHIEALRDYFPQYYISPKLREYVLPQGVYRFVAETSPEISELIDAALLNPAAPLYLGSNDGWIEAIWEVLA